MRFILRKNIYKFKIVLLHLGVIFFVLSIKINKFHKESFIISIASFLLFILLAVVNILLKSKKRKNVKINPESFLIINKNKEDKYYSNFDNYIFDKSENKKTEVYIDEDLVKQFSIEKIIYKKTFLTQNIKDLYNDILSHLRTGSLGN